MRISSVKEAEESRALRALNAKAPCVLMSYRNVSDGFLPRALAFSAAEVEWLSAIVNVSVCLVVRELPSACFAS